MADGEGLMVDGKPGAIASFVQTRAETVSLTHIAAKIISF
jgi:hypothetical protein